MVPSLAAGPNLFLTPLRRCGRYRDRRLPWGFHEDRAACRAEDRATASDRAAERLVGPRKGRIVLDVGASMNTIHREQR
jgi:hypothetical protein